MKISEAIAKLQAIKQRHGDLPIVGGYLHDDTPPRAFAVLNKHNEDIDHAVDRKAVGVFVA